jgi:hypothetical protein
LGGFRGFRVQRVSGVSGCRGFPVFPGLEAESRRVKSCMVESAACLGFKGSGVQGYRV